MSAQASSSGPVPAVAAAASTSGGPSQETLLGLFDSAVWYLLSLWPALHVACANGWGGPETLDKRDWFAGAVSDLLATRPDTDLEDLEEFLLNVMMDEFETNVDDESETEVAEGILLLRQRLVREGNVDAFRDVEHRWKNRGAMKMDVKIREVVQDVDGDVAENEEWVDSDGDLEMDDAGTQAQIQPTIREKPKPEVDEDGFTKVVSRKTR